MSNPSKARGTAAESAVVRHAKEHGFPWATRCALTGSNDSGDVTLLPYLQVIIEVKNHRGAPSNGQPPPAILTTWMGQTAKETTNAGADHGILVVKRAGTAQPGAWFAYLTTATFATLLSAPDAHTHPAASAPVCLSFDSALLLLRAAGYGQPPTDTTGTFAGSGVCGESA